MAQEFKRNAKNNFKKKPYRSADGKEGENRTDRKNGEGKKFSKDKSKRPFKNKPFRTSEGSEKEFGSEKRSGEKKSFSSDKSNKNKPAFERYRDDSKPSDFGSAKPKRLFNKDDKPRFGKKEGFRPKKKFTSKDDGYRGKPKSVNPFDIDDSDLEYAEGGAERSEKRFNKPKTNYKKSSESKAKNGDGLIRLNKYISNAGICSRREADELIASGVVQVNGVTITEMGYKVKPTDVIKYGGQTLKKERLVYLILNKPKDYITTVDDPEERRTVLELIHGACKERIYPVGRLDRATTGLLMFTNDGELTKKLTHPKYGVRKIYHVTLDKVLKRADLDKIAAGVELEDGPIAVDEISYVGDGMDKSEVGVELHSGRNRIIRRLFEHVGYNVRKLDRVMFGPLTKKDLPRGRWRFLTESEVGMLKMVSAK